jgi:hypothetical protein
MSSLNGMPPPRVVLRASVDITTRARAGRIQKITGKSLPKLLETVFRVWENRYVLPRLNPGERERYLHSQLGPEECQAIRKRAIEGTAENEIFDAADNAEQADIGEVV